MIAVWTLDRLADELGNVWSDSPIAGATRDRIIEKLTKLCARQVEEANK
jgi:hypothetical protein